MGSRPDELRNEIEQTRGELAYDVDRLADHTVRAVLTGFKKKGHSITSEKVDGIRVYRIFSTAVPL